MTKIVFDLERFKEWLNGIKSSNNYKLDISETPTAILLCDVYSGMPAHPMYHKEYRYSTVELSGRLEK